MFVPIRSGQVYCNLGKKHDKKRTCSNRAAARRLRERARKYDDEIKRREMHAEQHGALGVEEMVR
jgi:hypothetical protein